MLGKFEEAVMLVTATRPQGCFAADIVKILSANDATEVSAGGVQTTISRLIDKGFIRQGDSATDTFRGQPRKVFRLTHRGRKALNRSVLSTARLVTKAREAGHIFSS